MSETDAQKWIAGNPQLLLDAAATKAELEKSYWNDPMLHMDVGFESVPAAVHKQLVRALSQGIVAKP